MLESIHEVIREAEDVYVRGKTNLGRYVSFSMHDTLETIDAYLNSKHISGATDSLNREKPFFNIVTAAVNVWYRATDIDRKNIKFIPTSQSSVVLAFIANIMLQQWMDKNRFGHFLNHWGRELARYGSAIPKFVEKGGELIPSIVTWNRFIPDAVSFDAIPRIEKFYATPAELRKNDLYDQDVVSKLIDAQSTRKTIDGDQKDTMDNFIEIYEVHGEMDSRLLEDDPELNLESKKIKYVQQMHVVSYTASDGEDKFNDFTLYSGREKKDPYMITSLIEEDGRTLAIGAVEYLFDAQWMANHSVKNMKDTLDLASKLIFQTADPRYVGRNVLSSIETGDIFIHEVNKPLTRVANDSPDITAMQNFGAMWQNLGQEITSTPDALRGVTMPSGTPYSLGAFLGGQASSLFEIMVENKGLSIEDMMRNHVIPHLKKQLKNKDEIVGILDDAGVAEIDAMYIPRQAIRNHKKKAIDQIFKSIEDPNAQLPQPFDKQKEESQVAEDLGSLGNKRFFRPDELGKKQWSDILSDFQWDNIRVEVTNENVDKQAVLQTLSTVLQTVASNPMMLNDPNAKAVFSAILQETGKISPIQLTTAKPPAPQAGLTPASNPASAGVAENKLSANNTI